MATGFDPPPLLQVYGEARDELVDAITDVLRSSFAELDWNDREAVRAWARFAGELVGATQEEAIALASGFIADTTGVAQVATIDPAPLLEGLRTTAPASRYLSPAIDVWQAIDSLQDPSAVLPRVLDRVTTMATGDIDAARLAGEHRAMHQAGVRHYRRVLRSRNPCAFCYLVASNRFRIYPDGGDRFSRGDFRYHPRCSCVGVPLAPGTYRTDGTAAGVVTRAHASGETITIPEYDEWRPGKLKPHHHADLGPSFDYSTPRPRGIPRAATPSSPVSTSEISEISRGIPRDPLEELAARFGVTPAEIADARPYVPELRRRIADDAARLQYDQLGVLERSEARRIRRPPRNPADRGAEYDWLEQTSQAERDRLARKWWGDGPQQAPDLVADRLRRNLPGLENLTTDEILTRVWLPTNRRIEAAGALRQGKLPSVRQYGNLDPSSLAPTIAAEGYDIARVLGVDIDEAAAHIAAVTRHQAADDAARALGPAAAPVHGPPAWQMSYPAWEAEVLDLDYSITAGLADATARSRLAELIPYDLDDGALSLEELYATTIETARLAELDVASWAVIPWS